MHAPTLLRQIFTHKAIEDFVIVFTSCVPQREGDCKVQ